MRLNRIEAASLLVLAASVVFGVACGVGDDSFEEQWAQLGVPEPETVFLGDFSEEEKSAIRREVKSVQVSFAKRFGVVTSDFTLYISTDFEALNEAYREWLAPEWQRRGVELASWFRCGGLTWQEAIFITLETCDEDERAYGGPIAHEYFHILQDHVGLVGGSQFWASWLVEGAAVYASTQYAEEQGRWTVEWRRKVAHLQWASLGVCFTGSPLCSEGRDASQAHLTGRVDDIFQYEIGFLAVDWLVERRGEEALVQFFRLGGGRHEFEEAFDMTPGEFIEGMEEGRRDLAPSFEWQLRGRVLDSDGQPVPYAQIQFMMEVEDERVGVVGDRANVQGEFEVYGPDEDLTLGVFLKCPDGSREYWAFLGEWGRNGFVADIDGQFDSDDEGAEPVAGGRNRAGIAIELPASRKELREQHCGS